MQFEAETTKIFDNSVIALLAEKLLSQEKNETLNKLTLSIGLEKIDDKTQIEMNKLQAANNALSTKLIKVEKELTEVREELKKKNDRLQKIIETENRTMESDRLKERYEAAVKMFNRSP